MNQLKVSLLLFITVLSNSFNGIAQQNLDHLLIKNGTDGFIVLTAQGYMEGQGAILDSLTAYQDSLVLLPNRKISDLKVVYSNYKPFLIDPIEGFVYEFNNNSIQRIDRDYRHSYSYTPMFFSKDNELYAVGGTVNLNNNNALKHFNWDTKVWENITTNGIVPKGVKNAIYCFKGNALWAYHLKSIDDEFNEKEILNAYSLDLSNYHWRKQGVINPSLNKLVTDESKSTKAKYMNVVYNKEINSLITLDVINNNISINPLNNLPTFEQIIALDRENITYTYYDINQKLMAYNTHIKDQNNHLDYLVRDQRVFRDLQFGILAIIGTFLAIGLIGLNLSSKKYTLSGETLSNGVKKIQLEEREIEFITILADKKIVLNNEAMDIVIDPNNTYDANIKRKNNLVSKIERKLKGTFKSVLFSRERYKDDMRHTAFYLKNGYSIRHKE